jgi:hypothetical protein
MTKTSIAPSTETQMLSKFSGYWGIGQPQQRSANDQNTDDSKNDV